MSALSQMVPIERTSAYKLNEHGKYLLIAPSKDRAGTPGFRCVKDAQ